VAPADERVKINPKVFVEDFVRGASEVELREKYALSYSQLVRLLGVLEKRGDVTPADKTRRSGNLKIRFGNPEEPPATDTYRKGAVELDSGLVLHCPSCGAAVARGSQTCDYCAADLDFSMKGKTVNCPHCLSRTPADGNFCIRCARSIKGLVKEGKVLEDRLCPRCEMPLRGHDIGDFSVAACDKCNGFFVPHETFEMMQEKRDSVILPARETPKNAVEPESQVRYVRCPVCRNMMNRNNFARISGVIIDSCRGHGIWFDAGELEKVIDFITRGGLQKAKAVELERIKAEQKIAHIDSTPVSAGSGVYSIPAEWGESTGSLDLSHVLKWVFRTLF